MSWHVKLLLVYTQSSEAICHGRDGGREGRGRWWSADATNSPGNQAWSESPKNRRLLAVEN